MPLPTAPAASVSRPRLPAPDVALALGHESAAHRTELALLELDEARDHALGSTLLAGACVALLLCTGCALTLLVAGLVWDDPHRAWWLGGLCVTYLAATVATGWLLARRLRDWRPLQETRQQLQQDCLCLSNLLKSITR